MRRKLPSMAWLGRLRQTFLIKEKPKHLSKMSDRVSKMLKRKHLKFEITESIHRRIYR